MDQKETIEKKKEISKLNIIVAIASIVLAFAFVLFICRVVPICENLTDMREDYEDLKDAFEDLSSEYKAYYLAELGLDKFPTWAEYCNDYARYIAFFTDDDYDSNEDRADLSLGAVSAVFIKHIVNMVIAAFIAGIFGAKREALVKELGREESVVLEANTIPCPKCKTGIEKTSSEKLLKCPGCGTEYKNPFYKE